ncbi:MAG: ABC transporter substrate-binding protein, partial [Thermomicrobiales bacterium]
MYGETRGRAALVAGLSILALAFTACSSSDGKTSDSVASGGTGSSSSPSIKLGLLTPLTGSFADAGVNQQAGAQVAVDEINASGGLLGGQKLTLDVKDTGKGPDQSIQAMRDFTAAGTKLLLGELSTSNCLAIAPLI